ncbi:unnamed protein product [Amoebophrya sp. A25]|nr:unnamed protein product [Amoebophrya sp. A25]|eukprot:GSA25T00003639001.1
MAPQDDPMLMLQQQQQQYDPMQAQPQQQQQCDPMQAQQQQYDPMQAQPQQYMAATAPTMMQQQQQVYIQQEPLMLAVDEADVKLRSRRFLDWTARLEMILYWLFFTELLAIIISNASFKAEEVFVNATSSERRDEKLREWLGAGLASYLNLRAGGALRIAFAMTLLKLLAMAGFLVMMLIFRCSRCVTDLHWGEFRKGCGTRIMISVLGSLAGIVLLAFIITLSVYVRECSIGLVFPWAFGWRAIMWNSFGVLFVLFGLIRMLISYCRLAPKQEDALLV